VRLLIDTHVFLWWSKENRRLRKEARQAIGEAEIAFVSAASAWEAAIKRGLGKLDIPEPFEDAVQASGFSKLDVTFSHAAAVSELPRHHGDPFDRMLVAQALVEGLTLVTHDPHFRPYRVPVLWA
jgi:PIN domain nuclease of toxin-antitoxin system